MKTKILSLVLILSSVLYSSASLADEGTVLTWKTASGNWKLESMWTNSMSLVNSRNGTTCYRHGDK